MVSCCVQIKLTAPSRALNSILASRSVGRGGLLQGLGALPNGMPSARTFLRGGACPLILFEEVRIYLFYIKFIVLNSFVLNRVYSPDGPDGELCPSQGLRARNATAPPSRGSPCDSCVFRRADWS